MTRLDHCPEKWLPELQSILSSFARALAGRVPSVALLFDLLPQFEHCIPGHAVGIEHFPEGYSDDADWRPEVAVSLSGDRFKASWLLLESDLFRFVRSVN